MRNFDAPEADQTFDWPKVGDPQLVTSAEDTQHNFSSFSRGIVLDVTRWMDEMLSSSGGMLKLHHATGIKVRPCYQ